MTPAPTPADPSPEDLFADWLDGVEEGRDVPFAAFAEAHPKAAASLARIHTRWLAMNTAFAQVSRSTRGPATTTEPAPLAELLEQLRGHPDRWRRYTLGEELARGGMGRVVTAWDRELRRDVALKVQRVDAADARQRRRFVEEAQIAAQLDHPGIVPVHELGIDDQGQPFFAMRLVQGRALDEVIALQATGAEGWSLTRVLHVLLRVCDAVAYAHHKGVVHRDLKPQNIMVGRFGETYVMDWGLARVLNDLARNDTAPVATVRGDIAGEDAGSPLLTRSGDVVGTPAYMAPELAAGGAVRAEVAADIYALGAILWHLLAGKPPYASHGGRQLTTGDAVLAVLRESPPDPLPDHAPPELRAICERAMARDPIRRYPSVAALADDLRAFLELRVVSAYATGRFAELRKWIARNRAVSLSSALLVLALVVGVLVASDAWLAADRAERQASANARGLADELDRSQFRNARLAMRLDDPASAADALRRHHLAGKLPRATGLALQELAMRNPVIATVRAGGPPSIVHQAELDTVLVISDQGRLQLLEPTSLAPRHELAIGARHLTLLAAPRSERWLVAADRDQAVTLIDLPGGGERRELARHDQAITSLICAADGRGIASGDEGGTVRWWPAADGEPRTFANLGAAITSLAFDHGGERLAIGLRNGRVLVMGADGNRRLRRYVDNLSIGSVSFAADGSQLWVGSQGITVLSLPDGAVLRSIPPNNGACRNLVHAADGSVLAGGWWRIDRYAGLQADPEPIALVSSNAMAFAHDGRRLWSMRNGGFVEAIEVGQPWLRVLDGANGAIALAGDGRTACTYRGSDLVQIEVATGRELARLPAPGGGWLITDRLGTKVASVQKGTDGLRVFDLPGGSLRFSRNGPREVPFNESAQFSPDGRLLATVAGLDQVHLLDAATGELRSKHHVPDARIVRLRFSGDGTHLAIGWRGSRVVRVLDLASGTHQDLTFVLPVRDGTTSALAAIAIDHTGRRVAIGDWGGTLAVVDRERPGQRTLQAHSGTTWSLLFSPVDPELLVSSAGAGGITCWDLQSGEACYQLHRPAGLAAQVQMSQDGRTLAAYAGGQIAVVDLEYHERLVANTMASWLPTAAGPTAVVTAARVAELQTWAARVLTRPWPRWR